MKVHDMFFLHIQKSVIVHIFFPFFIGHTKTHKHLKTFYLSKLQLQISHTG